MSRMEDAKRKYEEIQIPEELSERVNAAIERSGRRKGQVGKRHGTMGLKKSAAAAAAALVLFTVTVNTDTALAEGIRGIPVVGSIARVLTFRSYEKEENGFKIAVEIPSIEMIAGDTNGVSKSVNQEIYRLCENYAKEAEERAREYREAFLATGGTEKEWEEHHIKIQVSYEIKAQTDAYLSLAVMGRENWNSAYSETKYFNIDLKDGKTVTLKDVLGDDYAAIAEASIRKQMEKKSEELGVEFWSPEEGGFSGIEEDQRFYMNGSGNPVVVFDKYAIAPGAAGEIEFEIEK